MRNIKSILFLAFLLLFVNVAAQEDYAFRQSFEIPVVKDGEPLTYAWTGGFNNPQFSRVDVNNDGFKDLVVFDRGDNQFVTAIYNDGKFVLDDNAIIEYPIVEAWAIFRDYNCDGIDDLFAPNGAGISVYDGQFNDENQLTFELSTSNIEGPDGTQYLFTQNALPVIEDIDGDGKLDILDFRPNSGFMYLYKNISAECESILLAVSDSCWGDFFESGLEKFAVIDTVCGGSGKPAPREEEEEVEGRGIHPGSTIQGVDFNNDGVIEVLIGNIMFNNILYLNNTGMPEDAHISDQDPDFPIDDVPISVQSFPGCYDVDVDFDGLYDILVSPFNINAMDAYFTSWFYKNIGTENEAKFELQSKSFMIDESFDAGWNSHPTFFDYNGDGLKDLVIGNKSSSIFGGPAKASLFLYENVGTDEAPSFEFVTNDYLELTELGLLDIIPAFGDLNGDGAEDLILGMSGLVDPSGDFNGILLYFENTSSAGEKATFAAPVIKYKDIDVGQFSAPVIFDVNEDGKMDLVIGNVSGLLQYFENIGTESEPNFAEPNKFWGKVAVGTTLDGFAVPQLFKSDEYDGIQLIVGSQPGDLKWYQIDQEGIEQDSFKLTNLNFDKISKLTSPAVADLTNDGIPEIFVGTRRGGLIAFNWQKEETMSLISENFINSKTLEVYPSPADNFINLDWEKANCTGIESIELYTSSGNMFFSRNYSDFSCHKKVNTNGMPSGIYILRVSTESQVISKKILIQH